MLRYVILEHTWDGVHFDLMLEGDGALRTWRLGRLPDDREDVALELPDHRLDYLTYEGAVSGGRGTVKRVASGQITLGCMEMETIDVELSGDCQGRLVMRRLNADRWCVRLKSGV